LEDKQIHQFPLFFICLILKSFLSKLFVVSNMKVIPLIYFEKRKLYTDNSGELVSLKDLLKEIDKETNVYILDKDGINNDRPNLCTYPKLSEHCKIWVDHGPRSLGDVVDAVLAGASSITIRKNIWPKASALKIKEITDSEIYEKFDTENHSYEKSSFLLSSDFKDFVVFPDKDRLDKEINYDDKIKKICKKFNTYVIEFDERYFSFWKKTGAKSIITEYNTWKKVKDYEF